MNTFVNGVKDRVTTTVTQNGDKTYSTSLDSCVDLFFQFGTLRAAPTRVQELFAAAYAQDPELALRIALYARDVRGGQGERNVFNAIMDWLREHNPVLFVNVLQFVPEFGYWRELLRYIDDKEDSYHAVLLFVDGLNAYNGLAAKYAPRKGPAAARIAGLMNLSPKQYRKLVVRYSKTVETQMCARQWDDINYSHVPSVAMKTYAKAFRRHSPELFQSYLDGVTRGETKINSSTLYPYDLIRGRRDRGATNAQWDALPDYVGDATFIPMIDTSSSMDCSSGVSGISCMDAAISIGMYLMERNKTAFKDLALTFDSTPEWIKSSTSTNVIDRFNHIRRASWGGSTDLRAAFRLVLDHAKRYNVPAEDMPKNLIVLTDMEFNPGRGYGYHQTSTFEDVAAEFQAAGYELPTIVFWNMSKQGKSTPVRYDQKGAVLVSGLSPAIMTTVLSGEATPVAAMLRAVNVPRYDAARFCLDAV